MKQLNILVYIILAAAILIAAYAVGLLVKHTRTSELEPQAQYVAEPNETPDPKPVVVGPGGRRGRAEPTPEEKAKIKEERAKMIAEASNLTDEQKAQLRDQVRTQMVPQRSTETQSEMAARREAWIRRRWPELSAEQREIINQKLQQGEVPPATILDANAPSSEGEVVEEDAKEGTADPNTTGQN